MPDAQTEAAMLIEALTQFAARHGIDAMLDLLEGVYACYSPVANEPRCIDMAVEKIEIGTIQ